MRVATAFSGGFGSVELSLKYLEIKHEVVFACEWMKPQRESYLLNHGEPTSNFYSDINDLDGTKYKGEIDYYHLSPPCQEYSMAGNRGGAATDKGALMFQAIKSIDEVQPKMFTVENVKGLLSSNGGEDWKNIMRDFKSLKGYTITWGVMNAKEQGTPQNRERVFIVGFRGQSPQFSFPKRVELKKVLRDVLEDEVDEKYFLSEKMFEYFTKGHAEKFSKSFGGRWSARDLDGVATCLRANGSLCPTDNTIKVKSATKQGYEEATENDSINLSFPDSKTRRGRVGKNVAQTLDYACNQGVMNDFKIRRLTPRECARVQGDFKDMFKFEKSSDTKLYEFIGNAMDISTTKNLITQMLKHCEIVKFTEPLEPSFERKEIAITNLFDLEEIA